MNRVKGFSEIVFHAELFEPQFLLIIAGTADDDDRNIGIQPAAPKVGEELETVQAGHLGICHNHIRHEALAKPAHGIEAVFRSGHVETFGKKSSDDLAEAVVVFYKENLAIHGLDFLIGQQSPATWYASSIEFKAGGLNKKSGSDNPLTPVLAGRQ